MFESYTFFSKSKKTRIFKSVLNVSNNCFFTKCNLLTYIIVSSTEFFLTFSSVGPLCAFELYQNKIFCVSSECFLFHPLFVFLWKLLNLLIYYVASCKIFHNSITMFFLLLHCTLETVYQKAFSNCYFPFFCTSEICCPKHQV